MEIIELNKLCDLSNGFAFKSSDYIEQSNTLNCRMSNIRPDGSFDIEYNIKYLPNEYADKYGKYKLKDNDLIIAMTDMAGDPKILGVPTVVDTKGYTVLLNQRVGKLTFTGNRKVDVRYLKYAISSKNIRNYLKRFAGGGLQLNVSKDDILSIPILYREIAEQKIIADILDKIIYLKKLREKQLQEIDTLIKSQFVKMFGDIFTNEKGYRIGEFNNFVLQMNIGPFGSALKNDYFVPKEDGYCMVYEQKHAIQKNIEVDRRYVDLNKYNELRRFEVGPGDIIVSCRGTIGECHILPYDAPRGVIHPSLMMIKPNYTVNAKFLLHLLERILERQIDNGSGVKMAIQAKELRKVKTIVPDRYLQDEYIHFVEQVDNLKFHVQQSLDETQKLYDSLMYEYFG